MKNNPKLLKTMWITSAVIILLAVTIQFGASQSKNDAKNNENDSKIAQNDAKKVDYSTLSGLTLVSNVSENLYTYKTAIDDQQYSISLGVSQSLLEQHRANYPLNRTEAPLNSVRVDYGYNDALKVNGQLVQPQYNSLAFDFEIDNTQYTGEITNQSGTSDKEGLLEVLDRLTAALN